MAKHRSVRAYKIAARKKDAPRAVVQRLEDEVSHLDKKKFKSLDAVLAQHKIDRKKL